MSAPFLGQIIMFAGNFAPRNYALCQGQLLPINTNQALFSILGTAYGGDGRTSFALPDLRGRTPRGSEENNAGPGLAPVPRGQKGGAESTTLQTGNLPAHSHTQQVSTAEGEEEDAYIPAKRPGEFHYRPVTDQGTLVDSAATTKAGGNQPLNHLNPYLGLNYLIATQGTFPPRN